MAAGASGCCPAGACSAAIRCCATRTSPAATCAASIPSSRPAWRWRRSRCMGARWRWCARHGEGERLTRVLDRIREKIVSELRPLDLAYQVLDGLHQLVEYDHSAAFLAYDGESGALRVEAEKIVWTKAKSPFVGREIPVSPERIARICRAIEVRAMTGGSGAGAGRGGGAGGGSAAAPGLPATAAAAATAVTA